MPDWNRVSNQREYKIVYFPDHPQAMKNGYVAVHRVVAEWMLSRPLHPTEIVHHRNGNKADNSPHNLEVLERTEHSRQHSTTGRSLALLECCNCGAEFEREMRQVKWESKPYCSTECLHAAMRV